MNEPMFRAWLLDSPPPSTVYENLPGRWVSESSWPSPNVTARTFFLNERGLDDEAGSSVALSILGDQSTGQDAGVWCSYGKPGDYPADQRGEDGRSLCFTSARLNEPLDVLGFPDVNLTVSADRPNALVAIRLCDVAPTGESTLITRGLLNLTHRDSHEHPEPLEPGKQYSVTVRLNAIGWAIPSGHRLRLAISPTYWPWAWPSPESVTLTVITGDASSLSLPGRDPSAGYENDPYPEPEISEPLEIEQVRSGETTVTKTTDLISGQTEVVYHSDGGRRRQPANDIEYEFIETDRFSIVADDPLSASVICTREAAMAEGELDVRVKTRSTLTADHEQFHVSNVLDAFEGDNRVFTKTWHTTVPRDHV
jgi:uncharacterized protein